VAQVTPAAPKKTAAPPAAVSSVANYVSGLQKQFGTNEIVHLVTEEVAADVEVIPTGIPALDLALGCGGIPRGRVIEVYGPEMSGKTTLALQIVAQAQREDPNCFAQFIDAEHALDLQYAQHLGVDLSRLPITQPDNGEQALEVAEFAVNNGAKVVVVDSVAALVPKSEIEGDMGEAQMGIQARLMSQAMRKLVGIAEKAGCTIIFINQIRMKIGVVYGNPETTTGGHALKFYASVRIEIRKGQPLKASDKADPHGQETKVKIVKNKCAPPFRTCTFDLIYGEGYDTVKSLIDVAIERGILKQAGAWVSYGDQKWQGLSAAKEALSKDPEVLAKIAEAL
jgi:recombination protein RecA